MSTTKYDREALAMRTDETVLNVIRDRGIRGLPPEDIYRRRPGGPGPADL